ncbi:hypothetical protein, partial [Bacillus subtilis]|uniref:hypothetical protein n=1 Tax=Bacillus subtilis TaxID=1423 RepID=UPI003C1F89C4
TPQEVWKATETDPVLKQQFSYENKVATQRPISPELQTNASAGGTLPEPKTPGHQLEALIKENTPEVKPSAVVERTEAESKILEQVGEKSKPVKEGYSFDKAYTDF